MSLAGWLPKNAFVMRKKNYSKNVTPKEAATTQPVSSLPITNLSTTVTTKIITKGNPLSKVLFITLDPLTGEALHTFEKMVQAMTFQLKDVLVTTVEENAVGVSQELRVLFQKIYPEVVVCLGKESLEMLEALNLEEIKIVLIPHPAEMVQSPALKKTAWDELKKVMAILGIKK